jgi:hypothetical protein
MQQIIKGEIFKRLAFVRVLTCCVFLANIYGAYIQLHIVNTHISLEKEGGLLLQKDFDSSDIDIHAKRVSMELGIINKNAVYVDMAVAKNAKVMICLQLFCLLAILFFLYNCHRANKLLRN